MRAASFLPLVFVSLFAAAPGCGGEAFTTSDGSGGNTSASGGSGSGGDVGSGGSGSGGQGATGGNTSTGGSASGGGPSVDRSCGSTIECTIVQKGCCASCETPAADQMQALRVDAVDEYEQDVCGTDPPDCAACESPRNPHLFAECVRGTCEVMDIRMHPEAECAVDEDCTIVPAACCNCSAGNSPEDIVSLHLPAEVFFESQCATSVTPICGDCTWNAPPGVTTSCIGGFCAINPLP